MSKYIVNSEKGKIFWKITVMMHFTIPETIERKDANGTPYTVSRINVLMKNYQGGSIL